MQKFLLDMTNAGPSCRDPRKRTLKAA